MAHTANVPPKPEPKGGTWDEDIKMASPYPTPTTSPTFAVAPSIRGTMQQVPVTPEENNNDPKPWWKSPSLSVNWTVLSRFALGFWVLIIAVVTYDSLPSFSLSPLPSLGGALNPFAMGDDEHVVKCTQPPELFPKRHRVLWEEVMGRIDTKEFKREVVESLQGAIRIRTESFDNTPPPSDTPHPAYAPFPPFRAYLRDRFPLVHASPSSSPSHSSPPSSSSPPLPNSATPPPTPINLTLINHHALLYTWPGTSPSKPLLLCAHQDVVPVPPSTLPLWLHPPYDPVHDEKGRVWGRGASDDKSQLVAILSAIELLLTHPTYTPSRTLLLAFGFDEEASGFHGAAALAVELEKRWGVGGVGMVVDEGAGFYDLFGGESVSDAHIVRNERLPDAQGDSDGSPNTAHSDHSDDWNIGEGELEDEDPESEKGITLAIPGVSEKGVYNIRIEVDGPGGHSSFPPRHTTIGLLAEALVLLEGEGFEMRLTSQHPVYPLAQCLLRSPSLPIPFPLPRIPLLSPLLSPLLRPLSPLLYRLLTPLLRTLLSQTLRTPLGRFLALKIPQVKNNPLVRSLVPTTQAVDVVRGGVKSNALPERTWGVVNHRVSVVSRLGDVQKRYERVLKPFAEKYGLNFVAWNRTIHQSPSPYALTVLNATAHGVEPAPLTPTSPSDGPWNLLAGTIKATYRAHRERAWGRSSSRGLGLEGKAPGETQSPAQSSSQTAGTQREKQGEEGGRKKIRDVLVAPGMMTGNTDTRYYWRLSKHIFRYNHHFGGTNPDPGRNGVHTVNEWIDADVLVESVRFFVTLILNGDEGDLLDS